MITDKEIRLKYVGIPYKHLGRDMSGLDCWGVPKMIYSEFGIDLFDMEYEKDWAKNGKNYFMDNYYDKWEKVDTPKFLDVLLFSNFNGVVYHAGVFLSYGQFIQGSMMGVIITRLEGKWKYTLSGIYRYKDLK
jgi:cell wall-associated NlpC family hydrolase